MDLGEILCARIQSLETKGAQNVCSSSSEAALLVEMAARRLPYMVSLGLSWIWDGVIMKTGAGDVISNFDPSPRIAARHKHGPGPKWRQNY